MSQSFAGQLRGRAFDLSLLFRSFDVATAEGRAKERQRRIALTALASALAKVISVSTALISVPLTLHYLGTERYGMWMTMSSLVAMLGFADLGIGNGLLSSVASANGRDDRAEIRAYVSSAYGVLSLIALVVIVLFSLSYPLVDWFRIFNVQTEIARGEAGPALAVLICCFALAIPVGIVQKVQMGLQRGFMASLWQCLSSLMALAGVLLAIHRQAPLPWLLLAFVGAPLLAGAMNSLTFFLRLAPDIAPSWRSISMPATRSIAGIGMLFLVLQIVGALAYTSDNIIIAQMLGAAAVASYAVPVQMFGLISTVIVMALAPLWPAYGEAIARGDREWVRKILKRSFLLSVGVASVCSMILVAAGPWIIGVWVSHAVAPPLLLLVGLGVWKVVEAGGNSIAMLLNGANVVRLQVVLAAFMGIAAIILKIAFVGWIGVAGVVWATTLAYAIFSAAPLTIIVPRIVREMAAAR
ncbi:MAG: oligosaccharide flippase family protein [Roseiarcus sp.]